MIGLGAFILLGNLGIINAEEIFSTWWPITLVIGGTIILIANSSNWLWASALVIGGILLQLNELQYTDVDIWTFFWPAIFVVAGISIIFNRNISNTRLSQKSEDDLFVLMSGISQKNNAKEYTGGKVTAIMGGIELDLRDTQIKKEAKLHVFVLMGGIDLKVPREWVVKSKTGILLGGIDIKNNNGALEKDSQTLIISGDIIMGGIDVKY